MQKRPVSDELKRITVTRHNKNGTNCFMVKFAVMSGGKLCIYDVHPRRSRVLGDLSHESRDARSSRRLRQPHLEEK